MARTIEPMKNGRSAVLGFQGKVEALMGTGNERMKLERDLAAAIREQQAADAAIHPSKIAGDRPPNEALFERAASARSTVEALKRAIEQLGGNSEPPR